MFVALLVATCFAPRATQLSGWPLLNDASKRAFQYFVDRSNPTTGFTKDRSRNFTDDVPDHFVASIASTGYALAAYGIGFKRGWMSKDDASRRVKLTIRSLDTLAPKHEGWFYHWLNWETGKREWKSEVSTIDSAILFSGLIIAEEALEDPKVSAAAEQILHAVNWQYFLTDDGAKPDSLTFCMGWHPEDGFIKSRWSGYYEQMMLLVLGLGSDPKVPSAVWPAVERPLLTENGYSYFGGGPLFIHEMSHVLIDFKGKRDGLGNDYWVSSRNLVLMQRAYGAANPKHFKGYDINTWGLSACDTADGYGVQSAPGGDNGTLAPPSTFAAVLFAPTESIAAADSFLKNYPVAYGRYGFSSGINPSRNWIGPDVIGIDQGQMMLAIEAARDGLPQKLFMTNSVVQRGLKRIGLRATEEGPIESRHLRL